jgi:hypothetical protein
VEKMKFPGVNIGWNLGTVALGAGVLLLGPTLLTLAGGIAKSIVKTGIKSGMMLYDKGLDIAEEAKETMGELTSEAKAEIKLAKKEK